MIKVLFVCTGNICRSPTAQAVFHKRIANEDLSGLIIADSAGTHDYHVGQEPDDRAQTAASKRGYDLSSLRARQVCKKDFKDFDYILAMDEYNLDILNRLCPAEPRSKLGLLMEYSKNFATREVPDPYYGGAQGFETVLDMVEDAARGLLADIQGRLNQKERK